MAGKRQKTEDIVSKLRQIEVLQRQRDGIDQHGSAQMVPGDPD
ncbi:hypothetical protein SAMN04488045_1826 [Thalassococcus halodurans]|uniref:Uncharacterized protein n=1 Tax=Thalassococcus halodurans TaxID=373675 RepID=A0A1H5XCV2_9RHOB|nr:hypothetical protein SAMN04488045_1826 [Thalassococcus halodurans]